MTEVLDQLGGRKAFHEFVLSGNEEALENFYNSKRPSPVLGGESFVEQVRGRVGGLAREHPRYQRRRVQVGPEQVIERVAGLYKVSKQDVLRGRRGIENEARKVAMYLVRRCCDQTLQETARWFGLGSYGAVGWSCHGVQSKMQNQRKFRDRIDRLSAEICQQKIRPLSASRLPIVGESYSILPRANPFTPSVGYRIIPLINPSFGALNGKNFSLVFSPKAMR